MMYDKGLEERLPFHHLVKDAGYPPNITGGAANEQRTSDVGKLYMVFYQKYPDVAYFQRKLRSAPQRPGETNENPAHAFISRQIALIRRGFSEEKAFEMTENELADYIQREKDEQRIIRGFAFNNKARSYLNYSQQVAELESRAKA